MAVGIASVGVLAIGAARPDEPRRVMSPTADAQKPLAADKRHAAASAEMIEVRGRVVAPDGRPVAGAAVQAGHLDREIKPEPSATSGPDGQFMLRVPPWRRDSVRDRRDAGYPWVVASAAGFGPGWASAVREPGATGELTIRLVEEGLPIEGRIVNLEGRPVSGARVKAESIWSARKGPLSDWLPMASAESFDAPWEGLDELPATMTATTDADGRFRMAGIGRDRLVRLILSGPTIATARLYAMNRDGAAVAATDPPEQPRTIYHARRFEYAAASTTPIGGVIRDKDTGRPIAGILLRGMVFKERNLVPVPNVEATTDAQGHYRLNGLPKGPAYRLFLEPAAGLPYIKATFRVVGGSPGLDPLTFDIALKRGVLVRGRVTDKATGRPAWGSIKAYTFADNPHVDEFPGYRESRGTYARVEDDGRYKVVTLPGRGLIACQSNQGLYRGGIGAEAIEEYDPRTGLINTLPHLCDVSVYHALAELAIDPGAESTTMDIQLDPGRTLTMTLLDPEGKPVGHSIVSGLTDLFSNAEYEQDSPTIEVHALDPSKPRRVTMTHAERKLVGSIYLKGDETGPSTVRLQPWGTITGRVIDDEGHPRRGLRLNNLGGLFPERPAEEGILPRSTSGPGIRLGRDGEFRIEGLVPGLKYGANTTEGPNGRDAIFQDVTVAPGEVKDLGNLKVAPPRRQHDM